MIRQQTMLMRLDQKAFDPFTWQEKEFPIGKIKELHSRRLVLLQITIVWQKFIGLSQRCPWASPVHISMWSKGS
jgi:hypothetical protein